MRCCAGQTGAFSSVGGSTSFSVYPSGEIGAETWELTSRYKQGVMVHLTSSGVIYSFDPFYLVNVLVAGLVLLGFASTVADFFAFWCLGGGQSTVLRNKRCEKVSKRSEFAETGLKAVLAAHQFQYLDRDGNGVIEAVDLVRALAGVAAAEGSGPAITPEQAHAIATAIMADADVDGSSASMSRLKSVGSLDFTEFMTCLDGDGGSFQFLLKKIQQQEGGVYPLVPCPLTHTYLTSSLYLRCTYWLSPAPSRCRRSSPTSPTASRPSTRRASRPRPMAPASGSASPCASRTRLLTWLLRCAWHRGSASPRGGGIATAPPSEQMCS